MKQEIFTLPPFISVILKKESKLLLVQRKNAKWYNGCFVLPGGKVDAEETLRQAAAREIEKELGITIEPTTLKLAHICHFKRETGFQGLDFYLLAEHWHGEPRNLEPDKQAQICWFEENKLPETMAPNHRAALEAIHKNIPYSELGWTE